MLTAVFTSVNATLYRCMIAPCGAGAPLFPLVHLLPHPFPFYFSLSFIGFTCFLLLSIPSLSTRIVPLRFQAGGGRRRPNVGFVFCFVLCVNLYSLVKMYCGVLFYLVLCVPSVLWHCWLGHLTRKNPSPYDLYCVWWDVKPYSINQSIDVWCGAQIEHVERFVSTVDNALRQRDNQHQLLSLATARIESYDAIEPPNDECVKVRDPWTVQLEVCSRVNSCVQGRK